MKKLISAIALAVVFSTQAFAAGDAACDKFVKAADAAGKRVGKPYPEQILGMLKQGCVKGKDSDAKVAKSTTCLEKAKTEADMQGCNKKQ